MFRKIVIYLPIFHIIRFIRRLGDMSGIPVLERGLCLSHLIAVVLESVRPAGSDAGDDGPKAPSKRLRQEGVQDRVDTRVRVGQDVRNDLHGDRHRCDGVHLHRLDRKNVYNHYSKHFPRISMI